MSETERAAELAAMTRAVQFCAYMLRTELGPGGILVDAPAPEQAAWEQAARYLETAPEYPMIPLHIWRRGTQETSAPAETAPLIDGEVQP